MKSAEQWVKKDIPFRANWIKLVKKIQDDAFQAGLDAADSVVWTKRDKWEDQLSDDGYIQYKVQAAEEIGNAIRNNR